MERQVESRRIEVPSSDLCRCGCGEVGLPDRADDAVLLALGRETAEALKQKALSGGARRQRAEYELFAWEERACVPLDAWVHGRERHFLGRPSPWWVAAWRERSKKI